MENIKFRGKHWLTGEWIFGGCVRSQIAHYIFSLNLDAFRVDPDTVGQCTGLLDKKGVKIYEGDWFRDKYGIQYHVTVDHIGWLFINGDVGYRADKFSTNVPAKLDGVVIGNIHEHGFPISEELERR